MSSSQTPFTILENGCGKLEGNKNNIVEIGEINEMAIVENNEYETIKAKLIGIEYKLYEVIVKDN